MPITRLAPAKVNLALHVVGQRADGYHLLDTLVTFADAADLITAEPDDRLRLAIEGPFAGALADPLEASADTNLVMRAARAMAAEAERLGIQQPGARLTLTKHLPIAAGIGGGSADAAATLHALNDLWTLGLDQRQLAAIGLALGADVPMCLAGLPARVTGIGEEVTPGPALPDHALVLVNPRIPVATPDVFRGLTRRDHPPLPDLPATWDGVDHLVGWLKDTRNDLQPPAEALAPAIRDAMALLAEVPGCHLARMSGSGATCFAIFGDQAAAIEARAALRLKRANWWVG